LKLSQRLVDFKCVLDKQQRPIAVSRWSQAESGNCQKLVITITVSFLAVFFLVCKM